MLGVGEEEEDVVGEEVVVVVGEVLGVFVGKAREQPSPPRLNEPFSAVFLVEILFRRG